MIDTKIIPLWNATQGDLAHLKAVKEQLSVPFLVQPVMAVQGLAGRVLAYGSRPSFPCDYRIVGTHCTVREGFEWATNLRQLPDVPFERTPTDPLFLDTESHSVDEMWNMEPRAFFRLGQYAWGDGPVQLTTDYNEMLAIIRDAPLVVGHHITPFDLSVLFGKDSIEPLEMALAGKVWDTKVHANLVYPAPESYTNRAGHTFYDAAKPEKAFVFLSLDNLSYQLGLTGKIGDLKALAKKYGGFGQIPLDDPEFVEYAVQDVVAVRDLYYALNQIHRDINYSDVYAAREQVSAAIDAQNSRNGFTVDVVKAQKRVDELAVRREQILEQIVEKYNLPTTGKSPWASNAGKEAIFAALADYGITPESTPDWTHTKPGKKFPKGTPSLGGAVLIELTEGTPAEELGVALAELKGQRSLAQLAIDSVQADGKAHPDISALQRSGRKSTTKPGLTVWSARGDKAQEKEYFVASEGCGILTLDYSQADARIVAACSGDEAFAERFAPGVDAHELTGRLVFTTEYDTNPYEYRQTSKMLGHAYAYRCGAKTLSKNSKQPITVTQKFVDAMKAAYPKVTAWQERVTVEGNSGWVTNDWGRKMRVDKDRAFTQAPAMYGQSGTREIMVDSLIRIARHDIRLITRLVAQVHDELVFDLPLVTAVEDAETIRGLMETSFKPRSGGQLVEFPVSVGKLADDWFQAGH